MMKSVFCVFLFFVCFYLVFLVHVVTCQDVTGPYIDLPVGGACVTTGSPSCLQCAQYNPCGWCSSGGGCLQGRASGDLTGTCPQSQWAWFLQDCVQNECLNPSSDCTFYSKCVEHNIPCASSKEAYALKYGQKFCNFFSGALLNDYSIQAQQWLISVRLCLQQALVPLVNRAIQGEHFTCSYLQDIAYTSEQSCYNQPSPSLPPLSACQMVTSNDWILILNNIRLIVANDQQYEKGLQQSINTCATCMKQYTAMFSLKLQISITITIHVNINVAVQQAVSKITGLSSNHVFCYTRNSKNRDMVTSDHRHFHTLAEGDADNTDNTTTVDVLLLGNSTDPTAPEPVVVNVTEAAQTVLATVNTTGSLLLNLTNTTSSDNITTPITVGVVTSEQCDTACVTPSSNFTVWNVSFASAPTNLTVIMDEQMNTVNASWTPGLSNDCQFIHWLVTLNIINNNHINETQVDNSTGITDNGISINSTATYLNITQLLLDAGDNSLYSIDTSSIIFNLSMLNISDICHYTVHVQEACTNELLNSAPAVMAVCDNSTIVGPVPNQFPPGNFSGSISTAGMILTFVLAIDTSNINDTSALSDELVTSLSHILGIDADRITVLSIVPSNTSLTSTTVSMIISAISSTSSRSSSTGFQPLSVDHSDSQYDMMHIGKKILDYVESNRQSQSDILTSTMDRSFGISEEWYEPQHKKQHKL